MFLSFDLGLEKNMANEQVTAKSIDSSDEVIENVLEVPDTSIVGPSSSVRTVGLGASAGPRGFAPNISSFARRSKYRLHSGSAYGP